MSAKLSVPLMRLMEFRRSPEPKSPMSLVGRNAPVVTPVSAADCPAKAESLRVPLKMAGVVLAFLVCFELPRREEAFEIQAATCIRIAGRFDALNVKTGDGSVDTRVLPGSKMASSWTIRTGDGSVDMVLPADFQANIDATTGDGHISLGIPVTVEGTFSRSQIRGRMNGGGQALTIHTGDGSIRLSKS